MPIARADKRRVSTKFEKVNHVAAEDGWTHVVRGSTSMNSLPRLVGQDLKNGVTSEKVTFAQDAALRKLQNIPSQSIYPTQTSVYDKEDLDKAFEKATSIWNDDTQSKFSSHVKTQIQHLINDAELTAIDTGICLGLGSLSNPMSKGGLIGNASLWQLILFLDIFDILSSRANRRPLSLFAQDPCFNSTDAAFLSSKGITVAQNSNGVDLISSSCFVYAPHFPLMWWPSKLRNMVSPLVIGNDVLEGLDQGKIISPEHLREVFRGVDDSEIPDLFVAEEFQRFAEAYKRIQLPAFELNSHPFMFTCIFWRGSNAHTS